MSNNKNFPYAAIDTPELLRDHYTALEQNWWHAMHTSGFDLAVVHAGRSQVFFEDDQGPAFKANPHMLQWLAPQYAVADTCLLIQPGQKTELLFLQPNDYWHAVPTPPDHLHAYLHTSTFTTIAELQTNCIQRAEQVSADDERIAFVGEPICQTLFAKNWQRNPQRLMHQLNFARAAKTEYELAAMRNASRMAALGHNAAAECFKSGGSEFDVHTAYLAASAQNESELPYGNIVAINEHAAFLHYQFQDRPVPQRLNSLLIDAGGQYRGYASDITRTYLFANANVSSGAQDHFAALLAAMQTHQQRLVDAVVPGSSYVQLQQLMHEQLAEILCNHDVLNCSAEQAFEQGLTEAFCPHGLGHLLGIQVHDVGGQQITASGELCAPPENYPALRFTRPITANMVLTVEPGLYFIPALLEPFRDGNEFFNWTSIDALYPFGGIRIEDNVRVLAAGIENLTRDAFAAVAPAELST